MSRRIKRCDHGFGFGLCLWSCCPSWDGKRDDLTMMGLEPCLACGRPYMPTTELEPGHCSLRCFVRRAGSPRAKRTADNVWAGEEEGEAFERQRENEPDEGWPEGDLHPSQVLLAIGETIGDTCSICRSRHGPEVRHACE